MTTHDETQRRAKAAAETVVQAALTWAARYYRENPGTTLDAPDTEEGWPDRPGSSERPLLEAVRDFHAVTGHSAPADALRGPVQT